MPQIQKRRRPVPKQQQRQRRLWIIVTCSVASSLLVRPFYFTFHTSLFAFERISHVPEYLLAARSSESDKQWPGWNPEIAKSIIDQALDFMRAPTLHNASSIGNDYQAANDDSVVPLRPPADMMATDSARLLQVIDDLDDRDLDQISCGTYKCFWPSRNDNTTGWLVAPNLPYQVARIRARSPGKLVDAPDPPRTIWHGMFFGWNLSKRMALPNSSLAIRHFYLDAPLLLSFSSSVNEGQNEEEVYAARRLAQKVNRIFEYEFPNGTESKSAKRFFGALSANSLLTNVNSTLGGVVAQRVQRAPESIKVIKRNNDFRKVYKLVRKMGYYKDRQVTPEFLRRILRGLDELAKLLETYPALWHDFQFAVDRHSGHVYHVDLDRSYEMFQNFRPKATAYQNFLQRQLPLMRCFLYRCAMEIIQTAMEFANLSNVAMRGVDPSPNKCKYRDGRPP